MIVSICFSIVIAAGFGFGLLNLAARVRENMPNLGGTAVWQHTIYLLSTNYPGGFVVFSSLLGATITIAAFVTALIALHYRRTWFLTLYAAGLLLNLVIILHSLEITDMISEIGTPRTRLVDILQNMNAFDALNLALFLGYWIWIVRSRRLQLILHHRVRLDDPLALGNEAPPDVQRRRNIARTALAFARLPPASLKVLVELILEEIARKAEAARVGLVIKTSNG